MEEQGSHIVVKFLKSDLKVRREDYTNPLVPMLLAQVELVEIKWGEGLLYYKNLSENYHIGLKDPELVAQINKILLQNLKKK